MNNLKFINKIILYNYICNSNNNYNDTDFLKDLLLFSRVVCRQKPVIILNKKNEILGVKNTLRKYNLNTFLNKLILFALPQIKKNFILNSDTFKLDYNFNISIALKSKTYFFEYKADIRPKLDYTSNINLIFNKSVTNTQKIDYINKILNIKL